MRNNTKDVMDDLNIGDTYTHNGKIWEKVGEGRYILVEVKDIYNNQPRDTIH